MMTPVISRNSSVAESNKSFSVLGPYFFAILPSNNSKQIAAPVYTTPEIMNSIRVACGSLNKNLKKKKNAIIAKSIETAGKNKDVHKK